MSFSQCGEQGTMRHNKRYGEEIVSRDKMLKCFSSVLCKPGIHFLDCNIPNQPGEVNVKKVSRFIAMMSPEM